MKTTEYFNETSGHFPAMLVVIKPETTVQDSVSPSVSVNPPSGNVSAPKPDENMTADA